MIKIKTGISYHVTGKIREHTAPSRITCITTLKKHVTIAKTSCDIAVLVYIHPAILLTIRVSMKKFSIVQNT